MPYADKLKAYAEIARARLSTDEFEAFGEQHFAPLEAAAHTGCSIINLPLSVYLGIRDGKFPSGETF